MQSKLTYTAAQHSKAASTASLTVFAAAEGQHVRYDDNGEVAAAASGGDDAIVTVDGWLQLRLPLHHVAHICCLRHRLTQAFAAKVSWCLCKANWCCC